MRICRVLGCGLAVLTLGAVVGCATGSAPKGPSPAHGFASTSALDDARRAVAEVQASGDSAEDATPFLRQAEAAEAKNDRKKAQAFAEKALQALRARRAIDTARPMLAEAMAADALRGDADKILDIAEAALKAGDPLRAEELAEQVRRQAESALEQRKAVQTSVSDLTAAQYRVRRGDSLWTIAAKAEVHGNAHYWPLILKANRHRIRDADLIYPGQLFTVERAPNPSDMQKAKRHAERRGPWSLGLVESADTDYLAK